MMSRSKQIQHTISHADLKTSLANWIEANVNCASREDLIGNLKALKRRLGEMREKGGYVMVSSEGMDITIYKIN